MILIVNQPDVDENRKETNAAGLRQERMTDQPHRPEIVMAEIGEDKKPHLWGFVVDIKGMELDAFESLDPVEEAVYRKGYMLGWQRK